MLKLRILMLLVIIMGSMIIGCGEDNGVINTTVLPTQAPEINTVYMPPSDLTKLVEDNKTGIEIIRNEVLVYFKEGVSDSNIQDIIKSVKGTVKGYILDINLYKIEIPDTPDLASVKNAIEILKVNPNVVSATLNSKQETNIFQSNDAEYSNWTNDRTWGLRMIEAPKAWDIEVGNLNTGIAIIDDGPDSTHEDLIENVYLYSSGPAGYVRTTGSGHGTHVSGIATARGNNNKGIAGVCWLSRLMLYDAFSVDPSTGDRGCIDSDQIAAIISAVNNGAKVINMSIGYSGIKINDDWKNFVAEKEIFFTSVFSYIKAHNVLVVFSAGNDNIDAQYNTPKGLALTPYYTNNILVVAACDKNYKKASFSNYGNVAEIAAPGVEIYSTVPGNKYESDYWDGTSMAAPYVTGLAGIIWAHNPSLTAGAVKEYILQGAIKGGKYFDDPLGHRIYIINAYESLKLTPPNSVYPVAVLLADATSSSGAPVTIRFDGTKSHAPSGTEALSSYIIDFGDNTSPISTPPNNLKIWDHTYNQTGSYTATLTVTDKYGVKDTDSVEISVGSSNVVIIVGKEDE